MPIHKHRPGWHAILRLDGIVEWTDPTGRHMTTHSIDHRTKVLTPPATSEPEEKTKALASAYEGPFSRLEHHIEHLAARARRDRPARRRLDGIPRHLRCAYQETIRTADGNVIQMYYTHAAGTKPKTTPGDPPY